LIVSPSFRDRLYIGLSDTAVSLARLPRGLRPAPVSLGVETFENPPAALAPVVEQALAALTRTGFKGEARVVLSGRLTRHVVCPWRAELTDPAERTGYARYRLKQVYGAGVEGWDVMVDAQDYGRAAIAAAVERAPLNRLIAAAAAAGINVVSVQPLLNLATRAFVKVRRRTPARAVLAAIEPRGLTLAAYDGLDCVAVSTRRLAAFEARAVRGVLAEELLALGWDVDAVPVFLWYAGPSAALAGVARQAVALPVSPALREADGSVNLARLAAAA